jgi:hypothetical protein
VLPLILRCHPGSFSVVLGHIVSTWALKCHPGSFIVALGHIVLNLCLLVSHWVFKCLKCYSGSRSVHFGLLVSPLVFYNHLGSSSVTLGLKCYSVSSSVTLDFIVLLWVL